MSKSQIFQLTIVSQNDPGCEFGTELYATVTAYSGGKLVNGSMPVNQKVKLPIPPAPGTTPPPSPTWFMELADSIDNASYSIEISGPAGYPTTKILLNGSDMKGWIAANKIDKTNQIYLESNCGIFGFAQENDVNGGNTNWIYTITGGVVHPHVHPPVN